MWYFIRPPVIFCTQHFFCFEPFLHFPFFTIMLCLLISCSKLIVYVLQYLLALGVFTEFFIFLLIQNEGFLIVLSTSEIQTIFMKFFNCSPLYFDFLYPAYLLTTRGKLRFTILLCTTLSIIISNLLVFLVYGIDTRFDKLYRGLLNIYVFKRPTKCIPYQNNCFGFNSQYYYHLLTFVYVGILVLILSVLLQQYYHSTIFCYTNSSFGTYLCLPSYVQYLF